MPLGPWPTFDACMADPDLAGRYDEDTRRRVCGAIKARAGDASPNATLEAGDALGGRITETDTYWIIHDAVGARAGVNARRQFKPWSDVKASAATLEGVPLVYGTGDAGHPIDPLDGDVLVDVDPLLGVGHVINVRADDARQVLLYDALLFKDVPAGYRVAASEVAKNQQLVAIVQAGDAVDNSGGYHYTGRREAGAYLDTAGDAAPYTVKQTDLRWGHMAIVYPMTVHRGACPAPKCGIGVAGDTEGHDCKGGAECCRTRMEAAVQQLVKERGLPRLAALRLVAQGAASAKA